MELSLCSRIGALDETKEFYVFLMGLEGIAAEEIRKLKILKEIEVQARTENFKCVHCGNYNQLSLYSVMRAILSIARYDKVVCAECERDFYLEKTGGLYRIGNQKHKEAGLSVLTALQKNYENKK